MPLTPEYYDATLEALSCARPVIARKMFGGAGYYLGDVFFAIADDDRLYFKVDSGNLEDYEARGMGPWVLDGKPSLNYRELPSEVILNRAELGNWIDASATAAVRLKGKRKK